MNKKYWLLEVHDYHDFDMAVDFYKSAGLNVKYEEVGCNFTYEAIFWTGKKPTSYIEKRKKHYKKLDE